MSDTLGKFSVDHMQHALNRGYHISLFNRATDTCEIVLKKSGLKIVLYVLRGKLDIGQITCKSLDGKFMCFADDNVLFDFDDMKKFSRLLEESETGHELMSKLPKITCDDYLISSDLIRSE